MSPAPKSCQIEQEEKIICAAVACIAESSLLNFTMSDIAKRASMSMGSIYKHMHSKEDVLVALSVRMGHNLKTIFERIFATSLTMPEQLIAIGLLNYCKVDLYPFSRHLDMLMSGDAVLKRASNFWIEKLEAADASVKNTFMTFGRQGIERGELTAEGDPDTHLHQLMLGCWAINVGYIQVNLQNCSRCLDRDQHEMPFPLPADDPHIDNYCRLINSFQWRQPLNKAGIERAVTTLKSLEYY